MLSKSQYNASRKNSKRNVTSEMFYINQKKKMARPKEKVTVMTKQ